MSLHTLQALQPVLGWLDDLPVPREDPDTVRRMAEDILAGPEYRDPPRSLWDRINEGISDFIGRLFELVGLGGGSVAPGLETILIGYRLPASRWTLNWSFSVVR